MKRALIVLLTLLLCSCTTSTRYGKCIGVADTQNPKLQYEVSWWNGAIAFFLAETVIVPIYTVAKEIQCPEGEKPDAPLDK